MVGFTHGVSLDPWPISYSELHHPPAHQYDVSFSQMPFPHYCQYKGAPYLRIHIHIAFPLETVAPGNGVHPERSVLTETTHHCRSTTGLCQPIQCYFPTQHVQSQHCLACLVSWAPTSPSVPILKKNCARQWHSQGSRQPQHCNYVKVN